MAWQGSSGPGYGYYMASSQTSSSSTTKIIKNQPKSQDRQLNREQHMEKVEIWRCTICYKEFGSKGGLNRHFTTVHEQPKPKQIKEAPKSIVPYGCTSKGMVSYGSTSKGMVPYGANAPSIVCRICGNNFASQGNLTRHMNTVHGTAVRSPAKPSVAVTNKLTQKNKTNVTINMINPVFYNNCNKY